MTDQRHLWPQVRQTALWTQSVLPQPGQVHLDVSLATKLRSPSASIFLRLSIMLMPYFVRYRLSRRLKRSHGKLAQSVQKFPPLSGHNLILQAKRVLHFLRSSPRQPGQLFRGCRKARQRLQFMPHGAIRATGFSRRAVNFFGIEREQTIQTGRIGRGLVAAGASLPGAARCSRQPSYCLSESNHIFAYVKAGRTQPP